MNTTHTTNSAAQKLDSCFLLLVTGFPPPDAINITQEVIASAERLVFNVQVLVQQNGDHMMGKLTARNRNMEHVHEATVSNHAMTVKTRAVLNICFAFASGPNSESKILFVFIRIVFVEPKRYIGDVMSLSDC